MQVIIFFHGYNLSKLIKRDINHLFCLKASRIPSHLLDIQNAFSILKKANIYLFLCISLDLPCRCNNEDLVWHNFYSANYKIWGVMLALGLGDAVEVQDLTGTPGYYDWHRCCEGGHLR